MNANRPIYHFRRSILSGYGAGTNEVCPFKESHNLIFMSHPHITPWQAFRAGIALVNSWNDCRTRFHYELVSNPLWGNMSIN